MTSLEKMKNDLATLMQNRDHAIHGYHQILGAISVLEQLIHREENPETEEDTKEPKKITQKKK